MPIHAGPYIVRSILSQKRWAEEFRKDADALEAKAIERRLAADDCDQKAARLAEGTDFNAAPPRT